MGDVRVHHDGVGVDHGADRVEVHRRALLRDRHRQHGVRDASRKHLSCKPFDACGRGALACPDREHAPSEHQHVATLDVLHRRLVDELRAGEPRVVGVDDPRQRGLALARGHRQRRHGDVVADPHRRVAREEQVGQRVDHEVGRVVQHRHQARVGDRAGGLELVEAQPRHQHVGQRGGVEVVDVPLDPSRHRHAEPRVGEHRLDRVDARLGHGQCLGHQVRQVQHLDAPVSHHAGERIVLVLCSRDPRDAVEQQPVVVARRQPRQLGTRGGAAPPSAGGRPRWSPRAGRWRGGRVVGRGHGGEGSDALAHGREASG